MLWRRALLAALTVLAACAAANGQDARQIVEQAVKTELVADAADHTHWLYYEVDSKPNVTVKQWVAETSTGNLTCVVEKNGVTFAKARQREDMDNFIGNPAAQANRRKSGEHDDQQATQMLSMLPRAFLWTKASTQGNDTILSFTPNPQFRPPTWQSRVFAAMAGVMVVNNTQHRIVSLKGHLIRDVKFFFGLLGDLQAGGSFDVERRELASGAWQITQTHVHIQGHALIFKTISEQEDDEKSRFEELPAYITLAQAENDLLEQSDRPAVRLFRPAPAYADQRIGSVGPMPAAMAGSRHRLGAGDPPDHMPD